MSEKVDCKFSHAEYYLLFFAKAPHMTLLISRRVPDGKVCLNETGELAVTKFAVEPVSLYS